MVGATPRKMELVGMHLAESFAGLQLCRASSLTLAPSLSLSLSIYSHGIVGEVLVSLLVFYNY